MINKFSLKAGQNGQLLPYETVRGIHLIQVELKGKGIGELKFPVERRLSDLEWWYYIIKYSDRFDGGEIGRCRDLGMPMRMEQVLRQLEYIGLDPKKREEYVKEEEEVDGYGDELKRVELKEKLKSLLNSFIDFDFQKISPPAVKQIKKSGQLLPRNLVEEMGNDYVGEGKITGDQLAIFVECLKKQEVISLVDS
jgi:hypothetical protein